MPRARELQARLGLTLVSTTPRWLGDNDLLVVKQDHEPPLVALPWSTWRICEALGRE